MNSENIIDPATFEALRDAMGADFLPELVQIYLDETPQIIEKLQQALAKQDCEAFRLAAHSIKSTSNSMGALPFGLLARELEMMGRAGSLEGAVGKVEGLLKAYDQVRESLEGLLHG